MTYCSYRTYNRTKFTLAGFGTQEEVIISNMINQNLNYTNANDINSKDVLSIHAILSKNEWSSILCKQS